MTQEELFCHIKALHDFCNQYPSDKPCKKCPLYIQDWQSYGSAYDDGDAWCSLVYAPCFWSLSLIKERLKGDEHGISEKDSKAR